MLQKSVQFAPAMFEVVLRRRGRTRWQWQVCDRAGRVIMQGFEESRPAAQYRGERALFLLLLTAGRCAPNNPDRHERYY
jgi:hypothetical protein